MNWHCGGCHRDIPAGIAHACPQIRTGAASWQPQRAETSTPLPRRTPRPVVGGAEPGGPPQYLTPEKLRMALAEHDKRIADEETRVVDEFREAFRQAHRSPAIITPVAEQPRPRWWARPLRLLLRIAGRLP